MALTLVREVTTSEHAGPPSVPLCLDVPDADIIVRSSDQANFRIHKSVLAMSSPFFRDLLSLPQPPNGEIVDGLPVVALPEDTGLLNSLMSLLYPVTTVIPDSYQKVLALASRCLPEVRDGISPVHYPCSHQSWGVSCASQG